MKKKIISYEEKEISKELKEKCIEYLKDNPIVIYWDYRDKLSLEHIEKLMKSKEAYYELENEILENNIDYQFELENELINNMKIEFEELKEYDNIDIRDEFLDYICVDFNIKQLIRNTPDVRIRIVIHSNYEGVNYAERGSGKFEYSAYVQQIKALLKGSYDKKSFQDELDNICSCCNQLIFYFKADVEQLIGIKEKFKNKITIPKNSWCGFYDNWNGSGSLLEIKLLENITLKKQHGKTKYDNISIVLDENNKYSVEEVYGLCNIPECNITVN